MNTLYFTLSYSEHLRWIRNIFIKLYVYAICTCKHNRLNLSTQYKNYILIYALCQVITVYSIYVYGDPLVEENLSP